MSQNISRRQFATACVAAGAAAGLSACSANPPKEQGGEGGAPSAETKASKLVVFAAASLTEALTKASESYEAENDGLTIECNFDSSGTLKTQIQEGADCDLFISASPKQMNALDAQAKSGNDGLDLVDHATRVDLLENKVTLVVSAGNPKSVKSFEGLKDLLAANDVLLAMGNSDVPVGQYTQKILAYMGLDEEALAQAGCITYGTNVKEVTSQVAEGTVDCGVIYKTDATSAKLTVVDEATEEMCGKVVYPAAVLKGSKSADVAKSFLEYLQGPDGSAAFEAVGFTPLAAR